mgnify:CR=1 FL=1
MQAKVGLGVIAVLFVALCALFIEATPYREGGVLMRQGRTPAKDIGAPDERQHANYIARLMHGKGLAVLEPNDPNLYENYQAHQPPLYYVLGAGFASVVGANPETETGARLRWLNVLLGLATIYGLYRFAVIAFEDEAVGLAAAAFGAGLPMSVALHSAVSNDPLLFCLCTYAMVGLAKIVRQPTERGGYLLYAVSAGLAMYTKSSAIMLLPIGALAGYLAGGERRWIRAVVLGAVPLLLAAPWLVRNATLYGDPLGQTVFTRAFQGSPQASDFINDLGASTYWFNWVGWTTARSMVGVFGYMDIYTLELSGAKASDTYYRLAIALLLGLALFGGVSALRAKEGDRRIHWLNLALGGVAFLLFLRFNAQYYQAQARYLLPALPAIATAIAFGATSLLKSKREYAWAALLAVLTLFTWLSYQTLGPAFDIRTRATARNQTNGTEVTMTPLAGVLRPEQC